jgi:hypothetical protein
VQFELDMEELQFIEFAGVIKRNWNSAWKSDPAVGVISVE